MLPWEIYDSSYLIIDQLRLARTLSTFVTSIANLVDVTGSVSTDVTTTNAGRVPELSYIARYQWDVRQQTTIADYSMNGKNLFIM